MKSFLFDTQPLVAEASGKTSGIGRRARRILDEYSAGSAQLFVSAASLIELWMMEKRGKVRFREPFGVLLKRWESSGFAVVPIEPDDVMAARGLSWEHDDIYDRLIVATALRLRVPVVTGDRAIRAWSGVESVW